MSSFLVHKLDKINKISTINQHKKVKYEISLIFFLVNYLDDINNSFSG